MLTPSRHKRVLSRLREWDSDIERFKDLVHRRPPGKRHKVEPALKELLIERKQITKSLRRCLVSRTSALAYLRLCFGLRRLGQRLQEIEDKVEKNAA